MAEELKTPCTEETKPDWSSESSSALQGEWEIVPDEDVTIPTLRYDALVRAEHTVELIKRAYVDKSLKYDSERVAFVKLLLGMETEDE